MGTYRIYADATPASLGGFVDDTVEWILHYPASGNIRFQFTGSCCELDNDGIPRTVASLSDIRLVTAGCVIATGAIQAECAGARQFDTITEEPLNTAGPGAGISWGLLPDFAYPSFPVSIADLAALGMGATGITDLGGVGDVFVGYAGFHGSHYISGEYAELVVIPNTGDPAGGETVEITGVDFVDGVTVTFDGISATDVVVGSTVSLTCTTPAHLSAVVTVVVNYPDDTTLTGVDAFEYTGLTLDPPIGTTFGGTIVTVTGLTIPEDSTATLDGEAIDLVFTDDVVTFETPGHSPEEVEFAVTFPDESIHTGVFHFYIFPSFTPSGGSPDGGTLVRINRWFHEEGDNTEFIPGATITFGGLAATDITFVDIDNYTCKTPPHFPGLVDVVINDISALGLEMEYPEEFAYGLTLKAPFINAGPDKLAKGPAPSVVTVTATTNAEDATFLWEQIGGPQAAEISAPDNLITNLTFTSYLPGVYTFRIKALLADLPYISDTMTVTIPVIKPPRINITGVA